MGCSLPLNTPPCPPTAPYELPPVSVRGKCYRNCTGLITPQVDINDPDSLRAGIDRMRQMTAEVQRQIQIASGQAPSDIYVYPRMEEIPPPPLNVPSRVDQKANIFNRMFDPNKRKIIVLVIAGFLLFLALTNTK